MKIDRLLILVSLLLILACQEKSAPEESRVLSTDRFLMVLGVAQDAGYPQAACIKSCCRHFWEGNTTAKHPACLALIDEAADQYWLFEASPEIKFQLEEIYSKTNITPGKMPEGIFLTHAHIGHYAGLVHLGREVVGADSVPVYVMPRMEAFLQTNGPWSQLVDLGNIKLMPLKADSVFWVDEKISIQALPVPHRDEFSETVGFQIQAGDLNFLFIPDIDKWEKWDRDIRTIIQEIDFAFLDATFFENGELPNRDMSEIPHPFVAESMAVFQDLNATDKSKVYFIHFNHTNPLIFDETARRIVLGKGFNLAEEGLKIEF